MTRLPVSHSVSHSPTQFEWGLCVCVCVCGLNTAVIRMTPVGVMHTGISQSSTDGHPMVGCLTCFFVISTKVAFVSRREKSRMQTGAPSCTSISSGHCWLTCSFLFSYSVQMFVTVPGHAVIMLCGDVIR